MKTFKSIVGGCALFAKANQLLEVSDATPRVGGIVDDAKKEFTSLKNKMGHVVTTIEHDVEQAVFKKVIELGGDNNKYHFDYERQAAHLNSLTESIKSGKKLRAANDDSPNCHTWRDNSKYAPTDPTGEYMFLPAWTGQVTPAAPKI